MKDELIDETVSVCTQCGTRRFERGGRIVRYRMPRRGEGWPHAPYDCLGNHRWEPMGLYR